MKTKLYFFLWVCLSTLLIACVDDDIEPDVVPVTGVSLNKTALALDEGESESLIATVIPDNATNKKVTWKSSDTSVATVNASGKVTAQAYRRDYVPHWHVPACHIPCTTRWARS